MPSRRILFWIAGALLVVAAFVWAFRPSPVAVDMAEIVRGPMQVTVAAEGVTRIREPYLVTAPITGSALRSPVEVGDAVERGGTVVARIRPASPGLLDARARAEAEAALGEATAAVHAGAANVARAETELTHAATDLERNRALADRGVIPRRALEASEQRLETARATLQAAQSELAMREATRERARAQLVGPDLAFAENSLGECCVEVTAPETGTVLSVENPSARLVQAGEALLTIGDLADLEIEVDLLSADAVRLVPGAPAEIDRWGGEGILNARVRRIDPRGRTRVSALGIEEQRVKVQLEFADPPEARAGLGDAFRVFARIVTWETDEALQVPISALFRVDGEWAVYRVEDGRARLSIVSLGQRTQAQAEVLSGLEAGDVVVAFPGDRIEEGSRVAARDGA
jgi:HlyD family secretion protein